MVCRRSERGIRLEDVTWPVVQSHLNAGATALLPIGAACKQHGCHLPMNTDRLQADWFADELSKAAHVVVWPPVGYGHYPAFVDYPGSCSVSYDTFKSIICEILNGISRAGARAIVVLNTGISTIGPLKAAIEQIGMGRGITLVNIYEGPDFREAAQRITAQPCGGHADELETSIMLAIAPHLVHMEKAETCIFEMTSGPLNRTDPKGPNYSPSGVYGDPTLATREKGKILVKAILSDLTKAVGGADSAP
ncbi:MAG: creatininase family protein [Gammaproteobacteria bacterium]